MNDGDTLYVYFSNTRNKLENSIVKENYSKHLEINQKSVLYRHHLFNYIIHSEITIVIILSKKIKM